MANNKEFLNVPKITPVELSSSATYFGLLGLNWNPCEDYVSFNIIVD